MIPAREASADDLPSLVELARVFVAESAYGWTFSDDLARWSLETRIADPCAAALIVEDDSGVSGAVLVGYGREFCTERIGYVEKLYVHPRARGTRAGRVLASGADEWFRQHLCWVAFATATAGVGQDRRFVNLLAKVGFVEIGPTLQRDYANG